MIGVVWWTFGGGKRRCHNQICGTPKISTVTNKFVVMLWNLVPAVLCILSLMTISASGQQHHQRQQLSPRRPTVSPAMEAYRNRWMAYLKARETTTTTRAPLHHTVGVRGGSDGNPLVINGFECERTYSFFPNRENPRMYHLCARSRDSWYVYHYFCPNGSLFSDGTGKCMQEHRGVTAQPGSSVTNMGSNNRRRPTRRTTRAPYHGLRRTPPTTPVTSTSTVPTTTFTTTTTSTTEATTSTTSEEPAEPIPEPDVDHSHEDVTEADQNVLVSSSEEETSVEEDTAKDIDLNVSIPGSEIITSSEQQGQSSNEVAGEEQEIEASDEVNMIIPDESVNGPSRLLVTTMPPSSTPRAKAINKQQTPSKLLKRMPVKVMKTAASSVESEVRSLATALGGRRPRILKKIKYWRDFLKGKQNY